MEYRRQTALIFLWSVSLEMQVKIGYTQGVAGIPLFAISRVCVCFPQANAPKKNTNIQIIGEKNENFSIFLGSS